MRRLGLFPCALRHRWSGDPEKDRVGRRDNGAEVHVQARRALDRPPVGNRVDPARSREPAPSRAVSPPGAVESVLRVRHNHLHVRAAPLHTVHLFSILTVATESVMWTVAAVWVARRS